MARGRPGRKAAIDPAVREEALKIAAARGPDAAARELGLKSGTVRSWVRREHLRELRSRPEPGGGLEELKRIGQEMLSRGSADVDESASSTASSPSSPSSTASSPSSILAEGASSGGKRRRRFVFWGDEAAPVPRPKRGMLGRFVRRGDEVLALPEPEPPPEPALSEEQKWRRLARLTGRGAVVSDAPAEERFDDATGLPRYERRLGRHG